MSLFDTLKTIIDGRDASPDDVSSIDSFVMCRWLSGDPRTIFVANELNRYFNLPVDKQYEFAKYLLNHKVKYLRYYKNTKRTGDELKNIARYYNISAEKAVEYAQLISEEEMNYINGLYAAK